MPLSATVRIIQDIPTRYLNEKPFKTRIEAEKIQGALPKELVSQINKLIESNKIPKSAQDKWVHISQSKDKEPQNKTEPEDELEQDLEKLEKSGHCLYAFRFSKRFKHPSIRGKLIFAVTFWDPFELIDRAGQMHGFFLDPPLEVVVPKPKDEWLKDMIEELARKGRPVTKRDIAFLNKNYKRFVDPHKKWLVVVFIPTWSIDGVLAIHSRTSGIQAMASSMVRTESRISEVVAQHEPLMAIAESQKTLEEAHKREHHAANDQIFNLSQEADESARREKAARTPMIITSGFKTFPELPQTFLPQEPGKVTVRSAIENIDWGNIANILLAVVGFFLVLSVAANPALIGVAALGAILLISALVIYFWRKRSVPIPVPEKMKEKAKEAKEELEEKVRGTT